MARTHWLPLVFGILTASAALAIPPAPSFIIYGSIRGEDGRPLDAGEGIVVISTTAGEIARGPTDPTVGKGINYTLHLPMDSGTHPVLYKATASQPDVLFTVKVLIGAKSYVPIAVAGRTLDTNKPGLRERFDFVLGIDEDEDGLPDSWEQGLIDSGLHDGLLTIHDVNPDDDADGDDLTNREEFLAGTYALDASDGMYLDILGMGSGIAHLEFLAARGRTYTIKSSIDLKTWTTLPISTDPTGVNADQFLRATDSDFVDVYIPGIPPEPARFFKLHVE